MLLTKVAVDSFRTIIEPQGIEIDPRVTILAGANESGKTNLLHAIQCLSLTTDFKPEDISKSKRDRYTKKILPVVSFTFILSKNDSEKLAKLVPGLANQSTVVIHKKGNGIKEYSLAIPKENVEQERINEEKNIMESLSSNEKNMEALKKQLELSKSSAENHKKLLRASSPQRLRLMAEQNKLDKQIAEMRRDLSKIEDEKAMLLRRLDQIKSEKANERTLQIDDSKMGNLIEMFPKVVYSKDIDFILESTPIPEIVQQKTPKAIAIGNLLKIGEIGDLTILNEEPRRLKPILRGVAGVISKKFSEAWSQEPLQIEIEKIGENLVCSISELIAVSSSPEERSEGFQWFFSFFANFMLESKEQTLNKVILLDEPAIRLHPKGQKDLLRLLEKMSENNQIIYTTHSPFLINRNFPQRIRVLYKNPQKGTIICNKPYSDGKTRFWEPLRSSIGVCLGDLFSLGEKNLIVEGISDQILITCISNKFAEIGATFLDLEEISIVPAMGALCVAYMAKFASSEELKTIALLDNDSEGKKGLSKISGEKRITVVSVDQLKPEAITMEDLIPENVYIDAVNSVYSRMKLEGYVEYRKSNEEKRKGIVEELDQHFKAMGYSFDKVLVAKELVQKVRIDETNSAEYEPFRKLFNIINGSES